jgi:hypothetical protein
MDREAAGIMRTISSLEWMRVVNEQGEMFGHVFDGRSPGAPESGTPRQQRVVGELLYGRRGLLEQLGFVEPDIQTIAWSDVVEIRNDTIVVVARKRGNKRR